MIDMTTENGQRAERHLRAEPIMWLTTVDGAGQPQSSPVWFVWDGATILHYSAHSQKVHNIRRNPKVSLHLSDDGQGGNILTLEGTAAIVPDPTPAHQTPAYLEKYANGIQRLGMTPKGFGDAYPVAIRVTPTRTRVY